MCNNRKNASDESTSELFVGKEKDYGEKYKPHLLEQYKLCVEMADRISLRRCNANNFFLSLNTLLITAIGVLSRLGSSLAIFNLLWVVITSFAGILFCWTWFVTIRCYRELNTAKFRVINEIEEKLPIAAFKVEWAFLNPRNKTTKYQELTRVERWVPTIFALLYSVLIILVTYPLFMSWAN